MLKTLDKVDKVDKVDKEEVRVRASVLITPALAKEWLTRNTDNRRLSKAVVHNYAQDMRAGRWLYGGDPIRFDAQGRLIDGQHRLAACIAAGVPFKNLVIDGLPMHVQEVCDQGLKRRPSDVLGLLGVEHAVAVAAAARWLLHFKELPKTKLAGITTPLIAAVVEKHPKLEDAAHRVYASGNTRDRFVIGVRPTLSIAMYYVGVYLLKEREAAEAFLSVFETGKPHFKNDPAQAWREYLIRMRTASTPVTRESQLRGTVHAWNLFRKKRWGGGKFIPPLDVTIDDLSQRAI